MRWGKTGTNPLDLLILRSEAKLVYANISYIVTVQERLATVNMSCKMLLCEAL